MGDGCDSATLPGVRRNPSSGLLDEPTSKPHTSVGASPPTPKADEKRSAARHPQVIAPKDLRSTVRREYAPGEQLSLEMALIPRPKTRGDCVEGERPCPFVSCRHHLYLDVLPEGSMRVNFPGKEIEEIPETCSLDVADVGETTLERVGELLNVTSERIRQIEGLVYAVLQSHLNKAP